MDPARCGSAIPASDALIVVVDGPGQHRLLRREYLGAFTLGCEAVHHLFAEH